MEYQEKYRKFKENSLTKEIDLAKEKLRHRVYRKQINSLKTQINLSNSPEPLENPLFQCYFSWKKKKYPRFYRKTSKRLRI